MKIKADLPNNNPGPKYTYNYSFSGVQKIDGAQTYYHIQGTKELKSASRLKNFGKACALTVATLGIGILFSSYVQRCWTKALFGRVSIHYFVPADKLSDAEKKDSNDKRNLLKQDVKDFGINPLYLANGISDKLTPELAKIIAQEDKELTLIAVNEFSHGRFVPTHLDHDKDLALARISSEKLHFKKLAAGLRLDPEFVAQALQRNPAIAAYVDFESFKDNRKFFCRVAELCLDLGLFNHASAALLNDPTFVTEIAESLKNNKVRKERLEGQMPQQFKGSKDIARALCIRSPRQLENMDPVLMSDRTFATELVKLRQYALAYVKQKQDLTFVGPFLSENGLLLQYAPQFKNDASLVKLALVQNPSAYMYVGNELKQENNVVLDAYNVSKNPDLIWLLNEANFRKLINQLDPTGAVLNPDNLGISIEEYLAKGNSVELVAKLNSMLAGLGNRIDGRTLFRLIEKHRDLKKDYFRNLTQKGIAPDSKTFNYYNKQFTAKENEHSHSVSAEARGSICNTYLISRNPDLIEWVNPSFFQMFIGTFDPKGVTYDIIIMDRMHITLEDAVVNCLGATSQEPVQHLSKILTDQNEKIRAANVDVDAATLMRLMDKYRRFERDWQFSKPAGWRYS